jgi:hypothetical protein
MTKIFHASNFDPKVKAEAQAYAKAMANNTRSNWGVAYVDHYNDGSVSGHYIAFPVDYR